jgi:hypothetical protein
LLVFLKDGRLFFSIRLKYLYRVLRLEIQIVRYLGAQFKRVFCMVVTSVNERTYGQASPDTHSLRIANQEKDTKQLLSLYNETDQYAREQGMITTPRDWNRDIEDMFSYGRLFVYEVDGNILVAGHVGNKDAKTGNSTDQHVGYLSRLYAHSSVLMAKSEEKYDHLRGLGRVFREQVEAWIKNHTDISTMLLHCDHHNRPALYESYLTAGYNLVGIDTVNNVQFARMQKPLKNS